MRLQSTSCIASLGMRLLWHSKADKIVNNFHGQNWFQFHGQMPFFMVKTLIFVVNTLMFSPTNFSCQITKYLGHKNLHSIPMPKFHAQPYSIPIYAQLRSNSISWSVTVSIYLHPMSATPSCLTSVSFECSLGTVTILHQRCRI